MNTTLEKPKPLNGLNLLDLDLKMSEEDYTNLIKQAKELDTDAPLLRRERNLDHTGRVAFPADAEALAKKRAVIAEHQAELDAEEQVMRDRADALRACITRRDEHQANSRLISDRLARARASLSAQPGIVRQIVLNNQRIDDDVRRSIGAYEDLKKAVPYLENLLGEEEKLLAEIAAEVEMITTKAARTPLCHTGHFPAPPFRLAGFRRFPCVTQPDRLF